MILVNADQAALVAIDLQRAFCAADGSVGRQGRDVSACMAVLPACASLIDAFRRASRPVIWTQMGFAADYADAGLLVSELRPGIAAAGGLRWGSDDVDLLLEPRPGEPVLRKARFSAFHRTRLWELLDRQSIRELVLVGVTTSMCVETTAREAGQRDLRLFVPRDAVADFDPEVHAASLDRIAYGFGHVVTTSDVLAAVESSTRSVPTTAAPDHPGQEFLHGSKRIRNQSYRRSQIRDPGPTTGR